MVAQVNRGLNSPTLFSIHAPLNLWRAGTWSVLLVLALTCSSYIFLTLSRPWARLDPNENLFPPPIHFSSISFAAPPSSFSWVNPGWPKVLRAVPCHSPLDWPVKELAGKTIHKSVKYTVKIAYDLWDWVLSKLILTRFECCSEMWQLHTRTGCLSSLPLAACEQCCHDTLWALFRSAIFWRSPWPSPQ